MKFIGGNNELIAEQGKTFDVQLACVDASGEVVKLGKPLTPIIPTSCSDSIINVCHCKTCIITYFFRKWTVINDSSRHSQKWCQETISADKNGYITEHGINERLGINVSGIGTNWRAYMNM